MKAIGKVMLFFSSYLLFFVVMLLKELQNFINNSKLESQIGGNVTAIEAIDTIPTAIIILIYSLLIFFSILSVFIFKKDYTFGSRKDKTQIIIKSVSNGSQEIVSYLLTMIVPLLGIDSISSIGLTNNWTKILSAIFIIIFVLPIYINSNLVVVNPTLVMLGYSINKICFYYAASPRIEFEGILLSNKKLDLTSISDKTLVEQIDINTFIIRRISNE
jgi:hypothetical protein